MRANHLRCLSLCGALFAVACAHDAPSRTSADSSDQELVASPTTGGEIVCGESQVFFASGSAELDEPGRRSLDSYARCLEQHAIDTVYVVGMTDPEGTAEENLALGRARARAVADYLRGIGCTTDFVIRSHGEHGASASAPLWPLERSATVEATGS